MRLLASKPAVADRRKRQLDVPEGADELGRAVDAKRGRAEHCSAFGVEMRYFPKGVKLYPFSFTKICPYLGFY